MTGRIAPPPSVLQMGLLDRIDYVDAFAASVPIDDTPDQLVGRVFARAPRWLRALVWVGQGRVVGLALDPASSCAVPGWRVVTSRPDLVIYAVGGDRVTPRIVATVDDGLFVLVTMIRYERASGRLAWGIGQVVHRFVARYLLARAGRLAAGPEVS